MFNCRKPAKPSPMKARNSRITRARFSRAKATRWRMRAPRRTRVGAPGHWLGDRGRAPWDSIGRLPVFRMRALTAAAHRGLKHCHPRALQPYGLAILPGCQGRRAVPGCGALMSPIHSLRPGAAAALGAPAIAMGATFLAFGAAVAAAGLGLGWALGASLLVYGMAGQLVLLQLGGAGVLPAALGATVANARFLPMALAIAPWLGRGWHRWLALPFIAITPWAAAMRVLPGLPEGQRLPWF
ncbi:MAG: branched-chain amino acid ABC transporter permease, partial [Acetobacteraceae bacterium]